MGSKIIADDYRSYEIERYLLLGRKAVTNLDSTLKSRDITLLTKIHMVKAVVFPVVRRTVKKAEKNWCSQTVVLERTLESALDRKVINPVNPKGNKPWMFTGRTNTEAETLALWPPDAKSQIIGKDHWKDWGQEDKGETDGWMASLTQWTCIWASSGRWWRTGKPGVLPSVGSQRVGHDWATQASLVAETVKNPPAMWEIWVWSLGWEDPLEEGMATHSSFLAWRTHKKNHKESDMTEWLSLH